jgi:hypothetical protein
MSRTLSAHNLGFASANRGTQRSDLAVQITYFEYIAVNLRQLSDSPAGQGLGRITADSAGRKRQHARHAAFALHRRQASISWRIKRLSLLSLPL